MVVSIRNLQRMEKPMTQFALVLIKIALWGNVETTLVSTHTSMVECFDHRDAVVSEVGRPIINYQAVCVVVDPSIIPDPEDFGEYPGRR